ALAEGQDLADHLVAQLGLLEDGVMAGEDMDLGSADVGAADLGQHPSRLGLGQLVPAELDVPGAAHVGDGAVHGRSSHPSVKGSRVSPVVSTHTAFVSR